MFQQFLAPIIVLCFCAFAVFAIAQGNWLLLGVGSAVPIGLMLLSRIEYLVIAGLFFALSSVTLPGLGFLANLHLYQILLLAYGLATVVRIIVSKERVQMPATRWFVYAFLANLALIVYMRGFGMRILGDSKIGGALYIQVGAMFLFYLASYATRLTSKQWRFAMIAMVVCTLIPAGASLLFILSRGQIYHQYYFLSFDRGVLESFQTYQQGGAMTRWGTLGSLSLIYFAPFLFLKFRGMNRLVYLLVIAASLAFASLSGYRSTFLQPILFVLLYVFLKARSKVAVIGTIFVVGMIVVIPVALVADLFPFPVQRVLSIIPFANVNPAIREVASGTIDWRYLLWSRGLEELHKYLLIGKGFAYDGAAYESSLRFAFSEYDLIEPSAIIGDFHLGILSAAVIFGLPGTLALVGFWISEGLRHWRLQQVEWADPAAKQFHFVFLILFIQTVAFQALLGAISVLLLHGTLFAGIMSALANSRHAPPKSERPVVRPAPPGRANAPVALPLVR